jgi:dihydropteroate synthase
VTFTPSTWTLRSHALDNADHTLIMGVVNVTPDSFSDRAAFVAESGAVDHDAAVRHGLRLWEQGADIIDVGGESTRPGSSAVPEEVEWQRAVPVVAGLAAAGAIVSIDTSKPRVAQAAIAAGAEAVNDITALRDGDMAALCADAGVGVVLMHMQGTPTTMQDDPSYGDVLAEVGEELAARAAAARKAGVDQAKICIDPGIGFGKTFAHNLELLDRLDELAAASGYPVMVGTSRKGFLGRILEDAEHPAVEADRDPATAATVALAIAKGAVMVRVHNVAASLQSARAADAIVRQGRS